MTPKELKQLAEFAAEFLGADEDSDSPKVFVGKSNYIIAVTEYNLFNRPLTAPILMHLGKREMEKRLWEWNSSYDLSGFQSGEKIHGCYCFGILTAPKCTIHNTQDENEFIAFWSAVMEAVNG